MATWNADPARFDHSLVMGNTWSPGEIRLLDGVDSPIDLTGTTGIVRMRTETGGTLLLSGTYTLTNAVDGRFNWVALPAATAGLSPGVYPYEVQVTFPDGTVRTVLMGRVSVLASVI